MRKIYSSKFNALETKLNALEKQLSSKPVSQLNKRTETEQWSVLDVIQHLILVEKASLAYVKKKSSFPDNLLDAGSFDFFRQWKMQFFMSLPIKIKAPKAVSGNNFRDDVSLAELLSEWRNERNKLHGFLEGYPIGFDKKLTYKHPFAGRLTLKSMLYFVETHYDRHLKQINRILASV